MTPVDDDPGCHRASFSARVLHFPGLCCCCGRPNPTTYYTAWHTREKGVRVVREETKHWKFPLCSECEDWILALDAIPDESSAWLGYAGSIGGGLFGVMIGGCCGPAVAGQNKVLGIVLFVAIAAASLCAAVVGIYMSHEHALRLRRRITRLRQEAEELCPGYVCDRYPVSYLGWHGSIHTFEFTNPRFYNEFCRLNHRKFVR
jgi:hypothetical protein